MKINLKLKNAMKKKPTELGKRIKLNLLYSVYYSNWKYKLLILVMLGVMKNMYLFHL